MTALIKASGISAGYGSRLVIRDVDLEVHPGEVVAVLGANGAGKTTTVMTLAGELPLTTGSIEWEGAVMRGPLYKRARAGLTLLTDRRLVFSHLTTRQNLAIGRGCDPDEVMALFPELRALGDRRGGLLSGGEQQMLSVGRALCSPTKLLIADELSLGLAPTIVGRLLDAIRAVADRGMGVLLVEQHVHRVLKVADRVYVMHKGAVELAMTADEAVKRMSEIEGFYLSGTAVEHNKRGREEVNHDDH